VLGLCFVVSVRVYARPWYALESVRWVWRVRLVLGLYKILFHLEALFHNNILCKHPLAFIILLLCNILHDITSYCTPPPSFEVL